MRVSRVLSGLLLIVAVLAACATSSTPAERTDRDLLTRADLETSQDFTAYDLIQQARPTWLRVRGPNSLRAGHPITVYVDGVRFGGTDALRGISTSSVERMRYYDASQAQTRFGLNNTNGVIEVVTRFR